MIDLRNIIRRRDDVMHRHAAAPTRASPGTERIQVLRDAGVMTSSVVNFFFSIVGARSGFIVSGRPCSVEGQPSSLMAYFHRVVADRMTAPRRSRHHLRVPMS